MKMKLSLSVLLALGCASVTVRAEADALQALESRIKKIESSFQRSSQPTTPVATAPGSIVVKGVRGRAFAVGPDGKKVRLKDGMVVAAGYRIETGNGASVGLSFGGSGSAVVLGANTDLKIEQATPPPATGTTSTTPVTPTIKLELKSGELVGNTTGMKSDAKFEVVTARGVVDLKAAEFAVTSTGILVVKSGSASYATMTTVNGQATPITTTVAANQVFTPSTSSKSATAPETKAQAVPPQVTVALANQFAQAAQLEQTTVPQTGTTPPTQNPSSTQPPVQTTPVVTTPPNSTTFDNIAKNNSPK